MLQSCVFVLVAVLAAARVAAPEPQFLPVAVRLELPTFVHQQKQSPSVPGPYNLKTSVKVNDDVNNDAALKNFIISTTSEPVVVTQNQPIVSSRIQEISGARNLKKRRRNKVNKGDSSAKSIILNHNSIWLLKTINDKPADEVLRTDKASVARDLKDATESSVVKVKKLDEKL
ncbi:hypothetical protein ABEB36_010005 [Hypothenemus hampei]|uniref:Uncharacterized protein n=1 Tax=Hypothenemus hampei TaxID=57062 RepID=A0ABD1EIP6_HYPHA